MLRCFAVSSLVSSLVLVTASPSYAGSCEDADELYQRSKKDPAQEGKLLAAAIELCPRHARALNQLGVLREEEGDLGDAMRLYDRAIIAEPAYPEPYAGIGDVLMKRSDFRGAAEAYASFLGRIDQLPDDDQARYAPHRADFAKRLSDARNRTPITTAEAIGRGIRLRTKRPRARDNAAGGRVDVSVFFAFDSADIAPESLASQIPEIVKALSQPELRGLRLEIAGHADSVGSADYNRRLSMRRAESIVEALIKRGVPRKRLVAKGYGESKPAASNDTLSGRAQNRRVELANLGQVE